MPPVETLKRPGSLLRSFDDRVFAGVCGGLATYLEVEVVWVRLGFVLATLLMGIGLIIYAILWVTIPEQPEEEGGAPGPPLATESPRAVLGVFLLTLGLLPILWKVLGFIVSLVSLKVLASIVLAAVGIFLLAYRRQ